MFPRVNLATTWSTVHVPPLSQTRQSPELVLPPVTLAHPTSLGQVLKQTQELTLLQLLFIRLQLRQQLILLLLRP